MAQGIQQNKTEVPTEAPTITRGGRLFSGKGILNYPDGYSKDRTPYTNPRSGARPGDIVQYGENYYLVGHTSAMPGGYYLSRTQVDRNGSILNPNAPIRPHTPVDHIEGGAPGRTPGTTKAMKEQADLDKFYADNPSLKPGAYSTGTQTPFSRGKQDYVVLGNDAGKQVLVTQGAAPQTAGELYKQLQKVPNERWAPGRLRPTNIPQVIPHGQLSDIRQNRSVGLHLPTGMALDTLSTKPQTPFKGQWQQAYNQAWARARYSRALDNPVTRGVGKVGKAVKFVAWDLPINYGAPVVNEYADYIGTQTRADMQRYADFVRRNKVPIIKPEGFEFYGGLAQEGANVAASVVPYATPNAPFLIIRDTKQLVTSPEDAIDYWKEDTRKLVAGNAAEKGQAFADYAALYKFRPKSRPKSIVIDKAGGVRIIEQGRIDGTKGKGEALYITDTTRKTVPYPRGVKLEDVQKALKGSVASHTLLEGQAQTVVAGKRGAGIRITNPTVFVTQNAWRDTSLNPLELPKGTQHIANAKEATKGTERRVAKLAAATERQRAKILAALETQNKRQALAPDALQKNFYPETTIEAAPKIRKLPYIEVAQDMSEAPGQYERLPWPEAVQEWLVEKLDYPTMTTQERTTGREGYQHHYGWPFTEVPVQPLVVDSPIVRTKEIPGRMKSTTYVDADGRTRSVAYRDTRKIPVKGRALSGYLYAPEKSYRYRKVVRLSEPEQHVTRVARIKREFRLPETYLGDTPKERMTSGTEPLDYQIHLDGKVKTQLYRYDKTEAPEPKKLIATRRVVNVNDPANRIFQEDAYRRVAEDARETRKLINKAKKSEQVSLRQYGETVTPVLTQADELWGSLQRGEVTAAKLRVIKNEYIKKLEQQLVEKKSLLRKIERGLLQTKPIKSIYDSPIYKEMLHEAEMRREALRQLEPRRKMRQQKPVEQRPLRQGRPRPMKEISAALADDRPEALKRFGQTVDSGEQALKLVEPEEQQLPRRSLKERYKTGAIEGYKIVFTRGALPIAIPMTRNIAATKNIVKGATLNMQRSEIQTKQEQKTHQKNVSEQQAKQETRQNSTLTQRGESKLTQKSTQRQLQEEKQLYTMAQRMLSKQGVPRPVDSSASKVGYVPLVEDKQGNRMPMLPYKTMQDAVMAAMRYTDETPSTKFTVAKVQRPNLQYAKAIPYKTPNKFRETRKGHWEEKRRFQKDKRGERLWSLMRD